MKQKTSKAQREFDKAYDNAFKQHCNRVQFNIMDLGNHRSDTAAGIALGKTLEAAIDEATAKYRQN